MAMTPFETFEQWVKVHKEPHYSSGGEGFINEPLVSQNREELLAFAEMLEGLPNRRIALEIGLARGGTHHLWRTLYSHVISIDRNPLLIGMFLGELNAIGSPTQALSNFIVGDSTTPDVLTQVKDAIGTGTLDLLFIDGDHTYEGVAKDHSIYAPLVAPEGIVAFHDAISPLTGVPKFLEELGKQHTIHRIIKKSMMGIAWYQKEAE